MRWPSPWELMRVEPERHWQWLPYLAVAAAILGAVQGSGDLRVWERLLTTAVLAAVAAQALTPDWDTLEPPRHILAPLLAVYLLLLGQSLAALPASLRGRSFTALLALSALGTAVLVGYEVSAKFGQLGAIVAAALAGSALSAFFSQREANADPSHPTHLSLSNRGLALVYAIVVGGLAFVGMVEPTEPALPLLLAPAAPLVLWLFAAGPCSRLSGLPAFALKTLALLLVLAAVLACLLLAA